MLPTTTLETRDLRLVRAIAEAGGVTRAGRLLHLSQSAVSHQLKDLEARLGLVLFDRRGRGVQMTEAGGRVLAMSREVLEAMSRLEADLRRGAQPARSRPLRIATQCQTAYYWLPRVLGELERLHPDVVLRIVTDATGEPLAALSDGRIDAALVIDRPTAKRVRSVPLFSDELVAVLPPGHPLTGKPFVVGADLAEETLLLPDVPRATQAYARRKLWPDGGAPRRTMRVPLPEVIVELVRAGQGVSILPSWSVSVPLARREVCAVRATRGGMVRSWRAAWPRGSELEAAIVTLADLLRGLGPQPRASEGRAKSLPSPP